MSSIVEQSSVNVISKLDYVIQQNSNSAEKLLSTSQELNSQTYQLK